ncbi:IS66 family insertion sequence element accessory protein TnpB [Paenibacillus dendritiformis]|nr:IS66 family insertion sequence element accessory protein TnpB [Paenibacillus dendritiformis]NRF97843.1 IS66 family insertion sequence element accessory protein TnpB [Paenibacillus dendritiformis]
METNLQALCKERIAAYQASGQTMKAWCEKHDLTVHQLKYWLSKAKRQASVPRRTLHFVQWLSLDESKQSSPFRSKSALPGSTFVPVLTPFSSALLVFCNRRWDKLKILHWDHVGFWLYYRRSERGWFQLPADGMAPLCLMQREQLDARWSVARSAPGACPGLAGRVDLSLGSRSFLPSRRISFLWEKIGFPHPGTTPAANCQAGIAKYRTVGQTQTVRGTVPS